MNYLHDAADQDRSKLCVGIDLGTTHSLIAVFQHGKPVLIPNRYGQFLTPSIVGVLPDGQFIVGDSARDLRVTMPDSCASCFKRFMGQDRKVKLGSQTFTPHELSSIVLRSLRSDAEAFLGRSVSDAIITVPAYFNEHQRQATRLAGELAGFNVLRMINEPTAAALVYGFHDRQAEKNLCVVDLGGGTFDVTVMEVFEGTLEIKATAGESLLGGEDFTDIIVAAVLADEKGTLESAELEEPYRIARLRAECERAKRQLAEQEHVEIRLPKNDGTFGETPQLRKLTRIEFAQLSEPLLNRIAAPIARALRDSGLQSSDIDNVILVGGATRMPVLRDFVCDYFGKAPTVDFNPDEVVALGASIQTALMSQDAAVDDMVMTDVCPFTLGIAIAKNLVGTVRDGYFEPIIHRNSTIPISQEKVFSTSYPNQRQVSIQVYQGDARKVVDNVEVGRLDIEDLPPGPAGSPLWIRFTYDLSGVLEVEAYASGGKKYRTLLTSHIKGLSEERIAEARKRIESIKFYPREDLASQKLLGFAERMLGEIAPSLRSVLNDAIDFFEIAVEQGDRNTFDSARNNLIVVLSSLGLSDQDESV